MRERRSCDTDVPPVCALPGTQWKRSFGSTIASAQPTAASSGQVDRARRKTIPQTPARVEAAPRGMSGRVATGSAPKAKLCPQEVTQGPVAMGGCPGKARG